MLGPGVKVIAPDGGPPRRVYDSFTQTERFAVDGTVIYCNDSSISGRILRCLLVVVVVDEQSVCRANFGDGSAGTVVRVAK